MTSRARGNPVALDALRRWAVLLDSAFRIPGTGIRFGLDAIVGLIPGLGDISTPAFAALLLMQAVRMRLPVVVQARMVLNAAFDMLIGLVPILGDLADIGWKANLKNLALLERHARPGQSRSRLPRHLRAGHRNGPGRRHDRRACCRGLAGHREAAHPDAP